MSKPWRVYADHILDAVEKLRRIQDHGDVTTDEILYAASLRHLQTLAEATQRLPEQLKQAHPNIPWQDISGFRNILVHNYLGDIDPEAITTVLRSAHPTTGRHQSGDACHQTRWPRLKCRCDLPTMQPSASEPGPALGAEEWMSTEKGKCTLTPVLLGRIPCK